MINKTLQTLLQLIFISTIAIFSIPFMSSCGESFSDDLQKDLIGIWSVNEDPNFLWIFEENNTFVGTDGSEGKKGRWRISDKGKLIIEFVDPQMGKKVVYEFEIDADRLLIREPDGEFSFWLTRRSTKGLSEIPSEISNVIFEESDFSLPITLVLPCGDNPERIDKLKRGPHKLNPISQSKLLLARIPKEKLNVLIQNDYITEEKIEVTWAGLGGRGSDTRKFYHFTDKTKPFIHRINHYRGPLHEGMGDEFSETRLQECIKGGHYFSIKLASRQLKSIEYQNSYEVSATGSHEGYEAFAVRFSYTLQEIFPLYEELVKGTYRAEDLELDRIYEGEAKAYCEPDFREWKLESITLEDRGSLLW
jgi:hypothetical protein